MNIAMNEDFSIAYERSDEILANIKFYDLWKTDGFFDTKIRKEPSGLD